MEDGARRPLSYFLDTLTPLYTWRSYYKKEHNIIQQKPKGSFVYFLKKRYFCRRNDTTLHITNNDTTIMKHLILTIALWFSAMGIMAQAEFEEGYQFYNQKQYSKAVAIFQKYADEGVTQGQFNLAICYEKGNGVPKDYAKAAYWYEKAANQGDATAQSIIGDFYYDGTGVTQNYQKAVYWYEKAAN